MKMFRKLNGPIGGFYIATFAYDSGAGEYVGNYRLLVTEPGAAESPVLPGRDVGVRDRVETALARAHDLAVQEVLRIHDMFAERAPAVRPRRLEGRSRFNWDPLPA